VLRLTFAIVFVLALPRPVFAFDEASLDSLLQALHSDNAAVRAAAAQKIVLAEHSDLPLLVKHLFAPRKTDAETFRKLILQSWGQVPNPKGYDPMWLRKPEPPWTAPPREKGKPRVKRPPPHDPEALDWLAGLTDLDLKDPTIDTPSIITTWMPERVKGKNGKWLPPAPPPVLPPTTPLSPQQLADARGDALEIVALLRGLSHTQAPDAVEPLFRFAFEYEGVFRDECGRQLRGLSGYAVAPLLRLRYDKSKTSSAQRRRYAAYQLDRMDRSQPAKAIAMAPDETIRADTVHAYGEVYAIDAVEPVLGVTNDDSPRVRRAARWSWTRYITGNPPEAPKRKRKLGGGKEDSQETPDYLTYKELADLALRRTIAATFGAPAEPKATLQQLTDKLFAQYDQRRNASFDELYARAEQKAQTGDAAGAAELFKEILDHAPSYGRRQEMVQVFRGLGDAALARKDWAATRTNWQWASFLTVDRGAALPLNGRLTYLQVREAGATIAPQTRAELLERALQLDPGLLDAKRERDAILAQLARTRLLEQVASGGVLVLLFAACVLVWRRRVA
jgi:hypothetical protein